MCVCLCFFLPISLSLFPRMTIKKIFFVSTFELNEIERTKNKKTKSVTMGKINRFHREIHRDFVFCSFQLHINFEFVYSATGSLMQETKQSNKKSKTLPYLRSFEEKKNAEKMLLLETLFVYALMNVYSHSQYQLNNTYITNMY